MEFGSQKTSYCLIALFAGSLAAEELRLEVVHDHWRKGRPGVLIVGDHAIFFSEATQKEELSSHRWEWPYEAIQQLELAPDRIRILTYRDSRWKLGSDREYEFRPAAGARFDAVYEMLKDKLDQRLAAALADPPDRTLWEIPVKRLERFGGSHGVLLVGENSIAYRTNTRRESRTWRLSDIANLSSSGPFQLTVTTYEHARLHYGSRKDFNFQLKQALDERRYDELWRRLNRSKGLTVLTSYQENQ